MTESSVELVVASFPHADGAEKALQDLIATRRHDLGLIREAAVVVRDAGGKLHITESGDISAGWGAGSGAAVGAALGLFGGPLGVLIGGGIGAAIGGIAGHLIDSGIPNDRLAQVGELLQPGTSALVTMAAPAAVADLQADFANAGGTTLAQALSSESAKKLEAGKEVAQSALAATGGTITTRAGEGAAQTEAAAQQAKDTVN